MRHRRHLLLAVAAVLAAACAAPPHRAVAAPDDPADDLAGLSLEELMDVSIVSTARREVKLADTAAAVSVVTAEDIRRLGARSVPEALRHVPGVHVARIDAASWAVSIRGFSDRFSDKLLVMIDGRSVYTPLFSGVLWENLDLVMEDIAQIEVVRGPGAAVWGANAVNGVINIITRRAAADDPDLAGVGAGTFEHLQAAARTTGRLGDDGAVRGFVKHRRVGAAETADGDELEDDARNLHGGFRADWRGVRGGELTLQGTVSAVTARQSDVIYTGLVPPYAEVAHSDDSVTETALLAAWEQNGDDGRGRRLQMFWDATTIDYTDLDVDLTRIDLEYTARRAAGRHDLVWGADYRLADAGFGNSFSVAFFPEDQQVWNSSVFVNDDVTLAPDRWVLTLGAKLEYGSLPDEFTFQPNVRLRWTPRRDLALWASAARTARSPSIGARSTRVTLDVLPPGSLGPDSPVAWVRYLGDPDVRNERMTALEAGLRLRPRPWLSLDAAVFRNDYDRLLTSALQDPRLVPADGGPRLDVDMRMGNDLALATWGGELALDLRPAAWLRLRGAWSLLRNDYGRGDAHAEVPKIAPDGDPEHQVHAWLSLGPWRDLALDAAWRYVGTLGSYAVPAYRELTVRTAWRAGDAVTVGVAGHNLLDERHLEFRQTNLVVSKEAWIPRSVSADVTVEF